MSNKKKSSAHVNTRKHHKKKKHFPWFYVIYLLLIGAALAAIAYGVRWLRVEMTAYEAAQPKYVAEVTAQTFMERDFDTLFQYEQSDLFGPENKDAYVEYMKQATAGKTMTWREDYSADKNSKRIYTVELDGKKFGGFTLCKSGQFNDRGYELWKTESYTMTHNLIHSETYTVNVPSYARVYVDGTALGAESMTKKDMKLFEVAAELPEGAVIPSMCEYQFSRSFGVDEIRAVDAQGVDIPLQQDGNSYSGEYVFDDAKIDSAVLDRVTKVVRRLSCFMSDDYSRSSLCNDLIDNSNAYKYVRAFDNQWIASHKGYDFLNMTIDHFVQYSDTYFSVEARYDYKIIYKHTEEIYPTAYRLFFKQVKGTWYLYDFTLI